MSIKLYDGLRLTEHAPGLFELTRVIAKRMREVFRVLAVPVIAKNIARVVDDTEVRERDMGGPLHNYTVYRARKLWLDEQAGLDDRMTFHDPLRFSIVFGQVDDDYGTRRLAYSFAGNRAYTDALMALEADGRPFFVDYHYQNQADRPKEIRKDEWKRRRDDWNRLLDADDRETDDTLGHLPGWQLPDSIEGRLRRGAARIQGHHHRSERALHHRTPHAPGAQPGGDPRPGPRRGQRHQQSADPQQAYRARDRALPEHCRRSSHAPT